MKRSAAYYYLKCNHDGCSARSNSHDANVLEQHCLDSGWIIQWGVDLHYCPEHAGEHRQDVESANKQRAKHLADQITSKAKAEAEKEGGGECEDLQSPAAKE